MKSIGRKRSNLVDQALAPSLVVRTPLLPRVYAPLITDNKEGVGHLLPPGNTQNTKDAKSQVVKALIVQRVIAVTIMKRLEDDPREEE